MVDAGILGEDDRVELLEGQIVEVSPQGERHARVIQTLNRLLVRGPGDDYVVRPQLPLTLADSEPEPDLAVVRREDAASTDEHPAQAVLVVEVSGGSLAYDRTVKARVYARTAIPEFWIVDLDTRQVEVCRDPDPHEGGYRSRFNADSDAALSPAGLPGLTIPVAALFA